MTNTTYNHDDSDDYIITINTGDGDDDDYDDDDIDASWELWNIEKYCTENGLATPMSAYVKEEATEEDDVENENLGLGDEDRNHNEKQKREEEEVVDWLLNVMMGKCLPFSPKATFSPKAI